MPEEPLQEVLLPDRIYAARRHGRRWLGFEISPEYAEFARQRVA